MKHIKLLTNTLGIALALTLMLVISITASASTDKCTITMSDTTSSYEAYKLMDVTVSGTNYSYTVNSKYTTYMATALGLSGSYTDSDIITAIGNLSTAEVRTFADTVYTALKTAGVTADMTATAGVFSDVDYGYYLIVETAEGASGTYSLVMLDTADEKAIKVNTKEGTPEMTKKVMDTNDSTGENSSWQDSADYDIGDSVPFQLTGTVDSSIASYTTYAYTFHDKMCNGLTFDDTSVVVTIDGITVKSDCYSVVTGGLTDGCTFEVQFTDLKSCTDTSGNNIDVDADSQIVVTFNATLNDNADLGNNGNANTAYLEYSNNPYDSGTGKTTWDTVVVFTYKVVINKVDGSTNPLQGAAFTLYKYDSTTGDYTTTVGSFTAGTETTFSFSGLDDGIYKLVETTVPSGYNAIDDIYFTVTATHTTSGITPVSDPSSIAAYLTELTGSQNVSQLAAGAAITLSADLGEGSLTASVENKSGSELPSTGGMGTTIFYVIGVILILGAGIVLVTRRRMNR